MSGKPFYLTALAVVGVIVYVYAGNAHLRPGEGKRAAFGLAILALFVAAIGEASPEIANAFAALLLVAVLLGGSKAVATLLELPNRFVAK